ncbi:MAG: 2-keto-4-pentenoate hydratase [Alphaproteobacteria bacterium]|nr:2-keto-4-pentenoate hydratase [Alphaproteobacteria bacterium]
MEAVAPERFPPARNIAQRFVAARLKAEALEAYPGPVPPDLAAAYECQEIAIGLWPDRIAGWKIGRISPELEGTLGAQRLVGPIFHREVQHATGRPVSFGVFAGGFAAIEAEYVFEIGRDAPPGQMRWTPDDAAAIVGRLLVGIETAGSPLATINFLGPTVVVSDFGNNAGLILGPEIFNWRRRQPEELTAQSFIDGKSVGVGGASKILGGPVESLRFAAEHCARMGRPLKAGMYISTGAATGIHEIVAGQRARVDFDGAGSIDCVAKLRRPV